MTSNSYTIEILWNYIDCPFEHVVCKRDAQFDSMSTMDILNGVENYTFLTS